MRNLAKRLVTVWLPVVVALCPVADALAQGKVPTLNGKPMPAISPGTAYSFLVIGHGYGRSVSSHNMPHHLPAASLLANVELFREMKPDFVLMLGDVFWRFEPRWVDAFSKYIMGPVDRPFLNAVGNHDITRDTGDNERVVIDHAAYAKRFGPTYFSFTAGRDLHVVVDTVDRPMMIEGAQKKFIARTIARAEANPDIRNVFFWSHHLVWTQVDPRYRWVKGDPGNWNFLSDIYPLLRRLAKRKQVFWGSGNFGEPPNASLFYDRRKEDGITYFATGIGDTRYDLAVRISVDSDAKVTIEPVSLTDASLPSVDKFDVDMNREVADTWFGLDWSFLVMRPRLNPLTLREKLEMVLGIRFFWHGVVGASLAWLGLILTAGVVILLRRRRRRATGSAGE